MIRYDSHSLSQAYEWVEISFSSHPLILVVHKDILLIGSCEEMYILNEVLTNFRIVKASHHFSRGPPKIYKSLIQWFTPFGTLPTTKYFVYALNS